jgi:hypothetical protein
MQLEQTACASYRRGGGDEAAYTYDKPFREGRNYMTSHELMEAVNGSERHFRPFTSWGDAIDMHHRFIEGFKFDDSKKFVTISWGS